MRVGSSRGDIERDLIGIVVHDDYAPYFTLSDVTHAACSAHHTRELVAAAELDHEPWAKLMIRLLERAHRVAGYVCTRGRAVPDSLLQLFSTAWERILLQAIAYHEALPALKSGKRGRKKRRKGHNLALRLQKIFGCFRTEQGAEEFLIMQSIINTIRKQGWNVLDTLTQPNPLQLKDHLRM